MIQTAHCHLMKTILRLVMFLGCALFARAADRPNILFIAIDDLKPLLGCYDDGKVKSPNIDRLAARGVRFDRAYCNQAVCAPSRNTLMTGLRPTTLGVYDLATHFRDAMPDVVTLGQWFQRHGWRAESMGKIYHVGHGNYVDAATWSVPHWVPAVGRYLRPDTLAAIAAATGTVNADKGPAVECVDVPDEAYGDGMIAAEAIRRLRAAKERPGTPFLMAVGFSKPHLPFAAPKKYWDLYDRDAFEPAKRSTPPDGAPEFAPTTWGELRGYTDIPDVGPLTPDLQRELIHGYHAAVSFIDAQVGRVLDELDRLGLAGNTIIVLWGDHGWHLGDHGMWAKHSNYEEAARIPLMVVAPGVTQPSSHSSALVETVDLYPTLCALAGIPAPDGLDGASLVAALRDPATAATKDAVFHVYPRSPKGMGQLLGRAVRTARYRLVEWKQAGALADTAILELYDYQTDPGETKNLADQQPQIVAQLRAILAQQPEAKPQFQGDPADKTKKRRAPYTPES